MIDTDLLNLDLTSHIKLIKSKQISVDELLHQQLACIEKINPQINAFIDYQSPDKAVIEGNSIFAGAGIAVKDNIDVLGFATTAGMATRVGRVPNQDAFVIKRLRDAGASILGKLNMHEGALGATNQNPHFGDCHNPHRLGFTPGGSSGGSAAAVASGMVSLALGTDTMGSVRIPASYCGIFGFKPSRGAVSNGGSVACSRLMDNIGPMTRSAQDLHLAYSVMAAYDPHCAQSIEYDFAHYDNASSKRLLVPENLSELGVAADVIADFNANLTAFKELGFSIESFSFDDYDFPAARRAGLLICEAEMRVEHAEDWLSQNQNFSEYMRTMLSFVDRKSPMDVVKSERVLDNAKVVAETLLHNNALLLMPTSPQRAFSFETPVPANQADLTSFANQAGLPAISIPMLTDAQLPSGMQIVGSIGSDYRLLEIAMLWQQHTQYQYALPAIVTD